MPSGQGDHDGPGSTAHEWFHWDYTGGQWSVWGENSVDNSKTLKEWEHSHSFREEVQDGGGKRLASWTWALNVGRGIWAIHLNTAPTHQEEGWWWWVGGGVVRVGVGGCEWSVKEEAASFLNCCSSEANGWIWAWEILSKENDWEL